MRSIFKSTLIIVSACTFSTFAQGPQPTRPANFKPYTHPLSVEQLNKKLSKSMMQSAAKEMEQLKKTNDAGTYKPTLESLDKHPAPDWYKDAKLGFFLDWGLYSIASYAKKDWSRARYPDWYLSNMYAGLKDYHGKTWGADFQRDDFIPLFTANNFSAKEIVGLAKQCGARYFIPFNKHHDGYCLWDSKFTQRDAVDMFPHRDLTAEMVSECKKNNLYHGFYFSVEDYEYPLIDENGNLKLRLWSKSIAPDNAGQVGKAGDVSIDFDPKFHNKVVSGKIPVKNFVDDYLAPQGKDFIDKYDPDILWFDGEWQRPAEYYKTPDLVAYFYNRAEGKKTVVANDRMGFGTREHHGDFYTSETDEVTKPMDFTWEENRSMSESYGFSWDDSLSRYMKPEQLIQMLIRIVAKGGNLNLIVNADGSGKIPETQTYLLKELGDWMKVNGEAIYGTRTYPVICDNTQLGQPVWYTRSKDGKYGYAIFFEWPRSETFIAVGGNPIWETQVTMLGYDKPIMWVETGKWGLVGKIPEEMGDPSKRPSKYATVLKFEWDKEDKFGQKRW